MPPQNRFVLDTSALLALRGDEVGAHRIESLLLEAKHIRAPLLLSFMSKLEIMYLVWREEGEDAARHALRLIDSFAIRWISCDPEILNAAARIKANGKISIADSWIGATALVHNAILVHKDPEFEPFKEIRQEFLK